MYRLAALDDPGWSSEIGNVADAVQLQESGLVVPEQLLDLDSDQHLQQLPLSGMGDISMRRVHGEAQKIMDAISDAQRREDSPDDHSLHHDGMMMMMITFITLAPSAIERAQVVGLDHALAQDPSIASHFARLGPEI